MYVGGIFEDDPKWTEVAERLISKSPCNIKGVSLCVARIFEDGQNKWTEVALPEGAEIVAGAD